MPVAGGPQEPSPRETWGAGPSPEGLWGDAVPPPPWDPAPELLAGRVPRSWNGGTSSSKRS